MAKRKQHRSKNNHLQTVGPDLVKFRLFGKQIRVLILCVIGTIFIAFNGEILNKSYGQMGIYKQTGTFLVCFEDDFFEKVWSRYRYTLFVMKVKQKMTYYCVKRM